MKILHLEDNLADTELVRELLKETDTDYHVTTVDTREAYLRELQHGKFDVILSDFSLPGFDGMAALTLAQEHFPDTPFVFFSGSIGEDRAIETLHAGAADYVLKDNLKRLCPVLKRVVHEAEERRRRREIEAQLAERDARLRAIFEHEPESIKLLDREGRVLEMNPSGVQLLEAESLDRIHHQSFHPFVVAEHRDAFRRVHAQALNGQASSLEFEIISLKGRRRYLEAHNLPFRDASGRIVAVLSLARDITERKRSEERYRRLVEQARDIIFTIDHEGRLTSLNQAFTALTGWPHDPWIGRTFPDLVHHDDVPVALDMFRRVLQGGRPPPFALRIKAADGSLREFENTLTPIEEGDHHGLLGIGRDVTERNRALAHIHEQNEVINKAPIAIVTTDLDHRVNYCNEGAMRLYGLAEHELVGHTADELFPAETMRVLGQGRDTTLASGAWRGEVPIHTKDGRHLIVEFFMSLIRDTAGRPRGRLSIGVDITEKKQLEEQFFRAQRMENLGLLAAGIAHDFNNILAPALMVVPLLRTRTQSPADQRLLTTLEKSAERGAALVRQILSFVHGTGGERLTVQPKHIARELASMIEETFPRSIQFELDIAADPWPIRANPTHIHQVLLNLCVNARDAMPQGGTLRLSVHNRQVDAESAAAIPGGRSGAYTVLEVADTGTGIPPEILARIWDPFFTTKGPQEGTGLGLATVRGIVTSHDGFCEVQSQIGVGTTFRVYLPATETDLAANVPNRPFASPHAQGELVLVVDDEPSVRELVSATLAAHGYRVLTASDGVEAAAFYAQRKDEIAAVLTDVHMPHLDGGALALVLRRLNPSVRLLFISGMSGSQHGPHLAPATGDIFLLKPFKPDALLAAVHQLIHNPPAHSGLEEASPGSPLATPTR